MTPPSFPDSSESHSQDANSSSLMRGTAIIAKYVETLPTKPGVYRMLNKKGQALYVGKARSLKKRVANYTQAERLTNRLQRMVAETETMEFVTTPTEVEALLLEANLIKQLAPRYNVLLRDDKAFPYILIPRDHPFPSLIKHRGSKTRKGYYFGPFASAGYVTETLTALHRAFLLRNCSDNVFANRTRPCLQFHIKRCTAPCVARVTEEEYDGQVKSALDFLSGRSSDIQAQLATEMQKASDVFDYERAQQFRDRIRALTSIQTRQGINVSGLEDADVIAAYQDAGQTCIQVFFFRTSRNNGTHALFPQHDKDLGPAEVLESFLGQFYSNHTPPPVILISHELADIETLAEALSMRAGSPVSLLVPQRGEKKRVMDHALANARDVLARKMAESATQNRLLEGVARTFGLDGPPQRIEIYDNSHISGTHAQGAMVVVGPEGFIKKAYRRFNIKGFDPDQKTSEPVAGGDDYAMLKEVLTRRFSRALKEEDPAVPSHAWPDLVLIDGGQGQLTVAQQVFADLGVTDVALAAIAKGPDRNAGQEQFFVPDQPPFRLEPKDPVLYFLQRLRDEAHRFAIGGHRAKRGKALGQNPLDEISGIGPGRKKALLHHFGSGYAVSRAGLSDLEAVPGISKAMAQKIYDHFHGA